MIDKLLILLLLVLPFYISCNISLLDRQDFFCPVQYNGDIVVRSDARGDGSFASPRNGRRLHKGIDLFAGVGTPVYAVRSGRVIGATSNNGMGKYVIIRHRGGIVTIYGHLNQICAHRGKFIRQGDVLGTVGKTGNAGSRAIQPHLHFEIRKSGIPQDPSEYL